MHIAACALLASLAVLWPAGGDDTQVPALQKRDAELLAAQVDALPAQRPGIVDVYAIGFAGDGQEDVFRNEVEYFRTLATQRLRARGVLTLVNHPDSFDKTPRPLATYDNLYDAFSGVAARMDTDEDIVLLYLTTHGTPDHELVLNFPPFVEDALTPDDLRGALEYTGIRNRVMVVSACYSGGFLPALRDPDALVITAARHDRPSFGCGAASNVTFFGRAWLVEALNRDTRLDAAFDHAATRIRAWERAEKIGASHPQVAMGKRIAARLQTWQAQEAAGAPLPYPYPLEPIGVAPAKTQARAEGDARGRSQGPRQGDASSSR